LYPIPALDVLKLYKWSSSSGSGEIAKDNGLTEISLLD
jgi:hypothetical protein